MDGSKKIAGIVFAGIMTLAITACKIQPPGYVGLYVDNVTSVNDTINPPEAPLNMVDIAMPHVVRTTTVMEAEPPVFLPLAEEMAYISPDSAYQHEVKELLKALTDSVHLLRQQTHELQKQMVEMPDTSVRREKLQDARPLDSLHTAVDSGQLIQVKKEPVDLLGNQVTELKTPAGRKTDTVNILEEKAKQPRGDSVNTDFRTTQVLQDKNETIEVVRKQLNEPQNSGIIRTDTVYVSRETVKPRVAESQQNEQLNLQLLREKDEQIQMLKSQLGTMQHATAGAPQPIHIIMEPAQVQPLKSQQSDTTLMQLLQAKNDTILFLQSRLQNLQLQPQKRDIVFSEKEAKETQPVEEFVAKKKATDLQVSQDTMRMLKTRVLSLEEQILRSKDTPALAGKEQKDVPNTALTDTTLLIAYYELGEIQPLKEESLLKQIKELCRKKTVANITLSGYTDRSGNEIINKEITTRRLNYLSGMIIPSVTKEKIFFQNFGDTFASEMVVNEERRIEIRIYAE
jgi:hypothetical protein